MAGNDIMVPVGVIKTGRLNLSYYTRYLKWNADRFVAADCDRHDVTAAGLVATHQRSRTDVSSDMPGDAVIARPGQIDHDRATDPADNPCNSKGRSVGDCGA